MVKTSTKFGGCCILLAALLVTSVAYAVTPRPAVMPWTTFSGPEMLHSAGRSTMISCPGGEVFLAMFRYLDDGSYVMGFAPSNGNIVFVYDSQRNNTETGFTEIGFGQMDPNKPDVIPALRWESWNPAKHSDACVVLFPVKA